MEMIKEIEAREEGADQRATEVMDLSELQLAMVGGGSGEVSPY